MRRNSNLSVLFICSVVFLFTLVLAGCQRGSGTSELTVDESIGSEQEAELLKVRANAFTDSITSAGYKVLGVFVDEQRHSVYYARAGLSTSDGDGNTALPPIIRKNIKTGSEQTIKIPVKMNGHSLMANLLVNSYASDGKILLLSTSNNNGQSNNAAFYEEPIDVFYLDVSDLSFHYVTGGRHWRIGKEKNYSDDTSIPYLADYNNDVKVPLSQVFDGSFCFDEITMDDVTDMYGSEDESEGPCIMCGVVDSPGGCMHVRSSPSAADDSNIIETWKNGTEVYYYFPDDSKWAIVRKEYDGPDIGYMSNKGIRFESL